MVVSMERWVGKVAIVTGASAGIGAAIAEALVKEGLIVAGFARRQERVEELAKNLQGQKGKLYPVKVDMTDEDQILKAFKWVKDNLGPINILVNNAGIRKGTDLSNGDTKLWRLMIDTNLLAYAIATREAIQDMNANGVNGHIVNMNSLLGHRVVYAPLQSVYPATKHAVTAMTETLRQELNVAGSRIKLTSISPGVVETEIRIAGGTTKTKEAEELFASVPKLQSEDVADTVVMALSTAPHVQIHEMIVQPLGERF